MRLIMSPMLVKSSPYNDRVERICPKGAGGLFTVALKGGYDACIKFVDNLKSLAMWQTGRCTFIGDPFGVHNPPSVDQRTTRGRRRQPECRAHFNRD